MKESIRTWLTEQFGSDEDLFNDLYGQYADEMRQASEAVASFLEAGDVAAIGEKAHAMKGMALQIGDAELADPCKKLQDAGRAGNLSDCSALVPQVRSLVSEL